MSFDASSDAEQVFLALLCQSYSPLLASLLPRLSLDIFQSLTVPTGHCAFCPALRLPQVTKLTLVVGRFGTEEVIISGLKSLLAMLDPVTLVIRLLKSDRRPQLPSALDLGHTFARSWRRLETVIFDGWLFYLLVDEDEDDEIEGDWSPFSAESWSDPFPSLEKLPRFQWRLEATTCRSSSLYRLLFYRGLLDWATQVELLFPSEWQRIQEERDLRLYVDSTEFLHICLLDTNS